MLFMGFLAFFSLVIRPGLLRAGEVWSSDWFLIWQIVDYIIIGSFVLHTFYELSTATNKGAFIKANAFRFVILFVFAMQLLIILLFLNDPEVINFAKSLGIVNLTKIYILFAQAFILIELLTQLGRINARLTSLPLSPPLIFVLSFALVITLGTILLLLPGAISPSEIGSITTKNGIKFINALFTATSATCVTGLIVVPTGTFFSRYGHNVILALIQIGGLGLMTFATFSALILRGEIGIQERVLLGDVMNIRVFGKIKSLITAIIVFTLSLEILGTIAFYFVTPSVNLSNHNPFYFSIFHAVSSFCNAGFSLWNENTIQFATKATGSLIVMTLVVLGGIGFIVLADFWNYLKLPPKKKRIKQPHFSLHSKFVILVTVILILFGAITIYILEHNKPSMASLTNNQRWLASFFQSITARTAGFNTVKISTMTAPALLILIFLMFIGASPGSTGGGIKTTTFGLLVVAVINKLKHNKNLRLFGRSIPWVLMNNAALIIFLSLSVAIIGSFALLVFEPKIAFMKILFEQMSALGTVGLSTGITFGLSTPSKIVIIITMLLGRIGPLTFLSAIMMNPRRSRLKYTEEDIMIG